MSQANRLWGAPHIHGELLKLGFTIAQSKVARYMYRGWQPSQGWRTFLTKHAEGIAAIDLFVLPTITKANAASPRGPAEEEIDEPSGKSLRPRNDIAQFESLL
jgi:hypothetical protein